MNRDGTQQNEAGSSPWAHDSAAEVLEHGRQGGRRFPPLDWRPRWWPSRGAASLLAVGLIIGLAAGYAAGYRQLPRNARPPTASSDSANPRPPVPAPVLVTAAPVEGVGAIIPGGPALNQGSDTCFALSGGKLQLGVQVTNGAAQAIGLGQIHTVLPLGGLRVISQRWAPCGALGTVRTPVTLGPGDSTWFSVTVQVLDGCPGPLPVQFIVDYTWAREHAAVNLPGFPDLGRVPYPGCAKSAG